NAPKPAAPVRRMTSLALRACLSSSPQGCGKETPPGADIFKDRPVPRPVSAGRGPGIGPGGKAGTSSTFGKEVWMLFGFGAGRTGRFWELSKPGLLGRTFGPVGIGARLFPANGSLTPGVTGSDSDWGA